MKIFTISKNDSGQRLDKYIIKLIPTLPKTLLYKYIRTKRIKINDMRCSQDYRLSEGDIVTFYVNDEFFSDNKDEDFKKIKPELQIVYEDKNIILVNKKPGVLVHSDEQEGFNTLINHIKSYLWNKGDYDPDSENTFAPALANRIDRNTGGIVIAAKNAETLRILNSKLHDREIKKLYLCVVCGKMSSESGLLTGYLFKDAQANKVYIEKDKTKQNLSIKTGYKVLEENKELGLSLLEVELLTGRTHQIRAHFASIGHPLLGDGKYGKTANQSNRRFQALLSYKLQFDFKTEAGILNYLNGRSFQIKTDDFIKEFF